MRFLSFYIIFFLVLVTSPIYPLSLAGNNETIEFLLPADNAVAPWEKTSKPEVYKDKELFNYIDGGADIYFEYGFQQVISQEYSHEEESIVADIYQMADPAAAFGIYSIHRDAYKPSVKIGDDGTEFDYQITFWQDRYYVVLLGYNNDRETKNALRQFAEYISLRIGKHSQPTPIISSLPKKHKIPRSESFLKGMLAVNSKLYLGQKNILDIDGVIVKAACARYKANADSAQLLVVSYASSVDADKHRNIVQTAFEKKYKSVGSAKTAALKDGKNRYYKVKAVRNLLFIIFKSTSQEMIHNILDS